MANYFPFDLLQRKVSDVINSQQGFLFNAERIDRNDLKPFTIRIISGRANVHQVFTFKNYYHFSRWFNGVQQGFKAQVDSENIGKVGERGTFKDVFSICSFQLNFLRGGHHHSGQLHSELKGTHYNFKVFNPQSDNNNYCGIKCIMGLLNKPLNIKELKQKYSIVPNKMIDVKTIMQIYKDYKTTDDKELRIVDLKVENIEECFNYIILDNNHYYVVEESEFFDINTLANKTTRRGLLTWDLETRVSKTEFVNVCADGNDTKSYLLKETILNIRYQNFRCEKLNKLCFTTDKEKSCTRKFLDWLIAEGKQCHFYNCIAHNCARFDLYFLVAQLTSEELKSCKMQLRGYSIIGFQYLSHLFKDSCCFIVNSLKNICKDFKIKASKKTTFNYNGISMTNENLCFYKPELDFWEFMELEKTEPKYWELYTDYCDFDCISLLEIWKQFSYGVKKLILTLDKCLIRKCSLNGANTIGSLSKKIVENWNSKRNKSLFSKLKLFTNDKEKYDFLRLFIRGGISHSHQKGRHYETVISADISSQYPASINNMMVPIGESRFVNAYNENIKGFYHLTNLKFNSEYSLKPISVKNDNDVLNWITGDEVKEAYLDSWMIEYLKKNYGLISFNCSRGLVSDEAVKGDLIFGKYVNTFYKEKALQDELKKIGKHNNAYRETIKLFLNSLTGKLVEDTSKYYSLNFSEDDLEDDERENINGVSIDTKHKEKINYWITCGIMCYSYSKRLLFEYMRCLPDKTNDVIHTETDSIYFNKKKCLNTFIDNINKYKGDYKEVKIGSALGNIKIEKESLGDSFFLGKKFYYLMTKEEEKMKIKGIPLKTIDDNGNELKIINYNTFVDVYNSKPSESPKKVEFITLHKQLFDKTLISSHKMSRTINSSFDYRDYF